jgi:hypothetical protein
MATISELMEGKVPGSVKVRREGWDEGCYFVPHFLADSCWHGVNQAGNYDDFYFNWDDWTLYTEPKRKTVMYLWAMCQLGYTIPFQTTDYYTTEEAVRDAFIDVVWCQRLDYTRIEVEEDA